MTESEMRGLDYFRQLRREGWSFNFLHDVGNIYIEHPQGESIPLCRPLGDMQVSRCQVGGSLALLLNSLDAVGGQEVENLLDWLEEEASLASLIATRMRAAGEDYNALLEKRRAIRFRRVSKLVKLLAVQGALLQLQKEET